MLCYDINLTGYWGQDYSLGAGFPLVSSSVVLMYPIRKTEDGGGSGTPGDSPAPTLAQGLPHLGTHQPYHVLQVHPTWGLTHSTMGPRSAPRWGTHQRIPSTSRSAEDPKGHMVPSTCNMLTLTATMSHT